MYKVYSSVSHSVMSDSLLPHGLYPTRLICLWNSPDKNTGVGCHFLLQGLFLTQGLNPGLPHCRHCRQNPFQLQLQEQIIFMSFLKSYSILPIPYETIKGIKTWRSNFVPQLGGGEGGRKHNTLHFLEWETGPKMP